MNAERPSILLVEDDVVSAEIYKAFLNEMPIKLMHAETGEKALLWIQGFMPNIVLLDLDLPDMNGMEILKYVQKRRLNIAVIIITVEESVNIIVEAMRNGAFDFIGKPLEQGKLLKTLKNALAQQEFYRKNFEISKYHGFVGASESIRMIYRIIEHIATSKAPVLITGESGTGKDLCAAAIHTQSRRSKKPFTVLNCAAIPKDLIASELFGHTKGSFTGAINDRRGAASQADEGTLFLDEIGDLELSLQATLLRFLQTGKFRRIGENEEESADVRFIFATNCDLAKKIHDGQFREDLYYRMNVVNISMPALRHRKDDIPLMANHFLVKFAKNEDKDFTHFSPEAEKLLLEYPWPGNVRQLQNVIQSVVVLYDDEIVTDSMLSNVIKKSQPKLLKENKSKLTEEYSEEIKPLWKTEKDAIEKAIKHCNGSIERAAKLLEIGPATIYRKKKQWNRSKNYDKN